MKKNIIITLAVSVVAATLMGCALAGNLAAERDSEKYIEPEFDLAETEGKIVVFVTMPAWIKTPIDLRVTLTKAFNTALTAKALIPVERLTSYNDVLKYRIAISDSGKNSAFEIANKLGAAYVLSVQVTDFDLTTFAERDFYNGTLKGNCCLFDADGNKLWPTNEEQNQCREISVGIEAYNGTVKTSVEHLSAAAAHCATRYFYKCKKLRFNIAEEQRKYDDYTW